MSPFKILLIEPEEDVRIGAVEVFAIYGAECVAVADFASAEKILASGVEFSAVIMAGTQSHGEILGIEKPYTADTLLRTAGVLKD